MGISVMWVSCSAAILLSISQKILYKEIIPCYFILKNSHLVFKINSSIREKIIGNMFFTQMNVLLKY